MALHRPKDKNRLYRYVLLYVWRIFHRRKINKQINKHKTYSSIQNVSQKKQKFYVLQMCQFWVCFNLNENLFTFRKSVCCCFLGKICLNWFVRFSSTQLAIIKSLFSKEWVRERDHFGVHLMVNQNTVWYANNGQIYRIKCWN